MRKGMWSAAAVIVLLSVGIVGFGGPQVRAAEPTRVAMGPSDDPVGFVPADITVPVGTTVEWFNDTDLQHDVKAEDGSFGTPGSALLGKGGKYQFTFSKVGGPFKYFCTPHKSSGMVGTVTVAAGAPPTTAATTPPTQPAAGGTTTTTRAATTTTTAKPAPGASSTTTTTTAGAAVTTTTLAPATTPTSAPDVAEVTTTSSAPEAHSEGGDESAAGTHGSSSDPKTNGVGVALAGVLTVLLAAISIKLLTAKT